MFLKILEVRHLFINNHLFRCTLPDCAKQTGLQVLINRCWGKSRRQGYSGLSASIGAKSPASYFYGNIYNGCFINL
jgi:hypothetical protein